jgi:hypothetical protein
MYNIITPQHSLTEGYGHKCHQLNAQEAAIKARGPEHIGWRRRRNLRKNNEDASDIHTKEAKTPAPYFRQLHLHCHPPYSTVHIHSDTPSTCHSVATVPNHHFLSHPFYYGSI